MLDNLKNIMSGNSIELIIFGETHGFLEENKVQEEIIKIFKPDLFLYEMLEETSLNNIKQIDDFLKEESSKDFSVISKFGELKETIKLARKYNLPIKGMDIKNMLRKNKDFLLRENLSEEEIKIEEEILKKREERQKDQLLSSLKSGKRVFASVGVYHLREDSPLMKLNLNYLIIYPTYNDQLVFEPPSNFKKENVSFKIKEIKNA